MSSRFVAGPGVPQPPPICRKSIPAFYNPQENPWRIQEWIAIDAVNAQGLVLEVNQTVTLEQIIEPMVLYSVTFQVGAWRISLDQIELLPGEAYANLFVARHAASIFEISGQTNYYEPISITPWNSGLQQIQLSQGTGNATTRTML